MILIRTIRSCYVTVLFPDAVILYVNQVSLAAGIQSKDMRAAIGTAVVGLDQDAVKNIYVR